MADELDVEAARSGDKDLARRDLRSARLEGLDLTDVDLSGAHLEGVQLQGANLAGANIGDAQLANADFSRAILTSAKIGQTSVFAAIFEGADMRHATLVGSHFSRANLKGADLRTADFRNTWLNEGTDFTGAIVDETTNFDGAHIFRPMARQDAFRFYDVERGILVRRKNGPRVIEAPEQPQAQNIQDKAEATKRINELLSALAPLQPPEENGEQTAGLGHNNPPEPTPLDRPTFDDVTVSLSAVVIELQKEDVRPDIIGTAAEKADRASSKIAAWVARKADMAADECVKQLGKTLADARVWMAGWLMISGKLGALVEILGAVLRH